MYASHSWSVCSNSIVQYKKTPLILAAWNESSQAPAIVERFLEDGADADAVDSVSGWDGGMVFGDTCLAC